MCFCSWPLVTKCLFFVKLLVGLELYAFVIPKSEVTIKYSSEHVQEANVQRNTLKNIQEAWRTITQDHFKKIARKLGSLEAKSKERGVAQDFWDVV